MFADYSESKVRTYKEGQITVSAQHVPTIFEIAKRIRGNQARIRNTVTLGP